MKTNEAVKIFEALAADIRLDVFRLLVKSAPEGLVAGEIAKILDIPSTNLSFHLKAIVHTGLATVEREGRFQRYRANIPMMLDIIAYLTAECCWEHPEECQKFRAKSQVPPHLFPQPLGAEPECTASGCKPSDCGESGGDASGLGESTTR